MNVRAFDASGASAIVAAAVGAATDDADYICVGDEIEAANDTTLR
jgi:hypothetical protein